MTNQFANGYALLVGVDENNTANWALPDVIKDIQAMERVLIDSERCAYPTDHIKVVTGKDATRQQILDSLEWLQTCIQEDTSQNSTVLIYFSGHGWRDANQDSPTYYLIPYDVRAKMISLSAIPATEFAEAINRLRPKRLLVVLDCCHAGGMKVKELSSNVPGFSPASIPPNIFVGNRDSMAFHPGTKGLETLQTGDGRAVLSSSRDTQISWIRNDHKMSIFTYHFIEALTGHATPLAGATEVLVSDVMSHVYRHVPKTVQQEYNAIQEPDYQVSGNFPIALLLGGKGLSSGMMAPDPLDELLLTKVIPAVTITNTGDGAVANNSGVAAGRDGIAIGGSVHGDVHTGRTSEKSIDKSTLSAQGTFAREKGVSAGDNAVAIGGDIHGNVYMGSYTDDPVEALNIYRRVLVTTYRHLSLRAIDPKASNPLEGSRQLDLAQIYVSLDTTARSLPGEDKSPPLGVLDATIQRRKLVLLGGPGSGKSTFLSYLTLCLAWHGLEPEQGWLERLPAWPRDEADLLPIPVVLRDFARCSPPPNPAEPRHLWNFIVDQLKMRNLAFVEKELLHYLGTGRVLLLLDGLDEVPRHEASRWVLQAVQAFVDQYANCRFIITCRTFTYQDADWHLRGLDALTIAEFDDRKIEQFVTAWYHELRRFQIVNAQAAPRLQNLLLEAVQRRDLRRLATNPLLLTVMAQIHTFRGKLPDSRTLLYRDAVELLLSRWDEIKEVKPLRELLTEVKLNTLDLERVLWQLAYNAHGKTRDASQDYLPDIGESELLSALATLHPNGRRVWALQLLEVIKLRAGLLFERVPGVYTFAHRTFQEYLAGAYLAAAPSADIAKTTKALASERTLWREVILMAIGRLVQVLGDWATPLMVVEELCPQKARRTSQEWLQVWLAGEVLEKMGIHRALQTENGRRLQKLVSQRMVALLQRKLLTPVERAAIGRTLGNIGDPRPGVGVQSESNSSDEDESLPDIAWCEVPAGSFQMGGDPLVARNYWAGTTIDIPYTYHISKYPITYAQFANFVAAKGYQNRRYWTAAGWQWRTREDVIQPKYWDDLEWNNPNHPVVGLSWYECYAYSQWLTEQLGYVVRLPTEAEWEKAARYPDGRYFPWGNQPSSGAANVDETYERKGYRTGEIDKNVKIGEHYVGRTTAVGLYDQHASALGLCDLSGTIWEWLLSGQYSHLNAHYIHHLPEEVDVEGDGRREMRGGSWKNDIARARLAYRASNPPSSQDNTDSFRLVRDDRFSLEAWKRQQQTIIKKLSIEEDKNSATPSRYRGKVTHVEQGQGQLETSDGARLIFQDTDLIGTSTYRSLRAADTVTFEFDDLDKTNAKRVKRLFLGQVRKWDKVVAFGFISFREGENAVEIYMHQNDIASVADWERMKPDEQVEFEIDDAFLYGETTQEARNIRIIDKTVTERQNAGT